MPRKHDWDSARRDYVQGYVKDDGTFFAEPRYCDIAKRHNISESMTRKKGADDDWTGQRNMFLARKEHAINEKRVDAMADQIVKFDSECSSTASSLVQIIRGKMAQSVTVDAQGRRQVTATAADLQALSSALAKAQAVGRLSMGESTENTKTEWVTITPELGMA